MLRLKAHNKKISKFSEIDQLILIPKKNWDDFPLGEGDYRLNGKKFKLRVYDIPCDCSQEMHNHRILDLRDIWNEEGMSEGKEMEIMR
jgi:hypothetical protein